MRHDTFYSAALGALVLLLAACESEKPSEAAATQAVSPSLEPTPPAPSATSAPPQPSAQVRAGGGLGAACTQLCSQTAQVGCTNHSACVPACQRSFDLPFCPAELTAFLACATKAGPGSWECSDQGTPALKNGHCEREQEAIIACVTKGAAR